MNRTDKSIRNLVFALIAQGVTVFLSFLLRTEMLRSLGILSVSINSLFTEVISALSLAEMGIGSAIVYNLYKPLAEGDEKKVCQLMYLFKKAYLIIAAATLCIGLALTPVIHLLIENVDISLGYLRIVYILFVVQNSSSYLFSYKISLISADQKTYIYTKINMICRIIGTIVLIAVIRITKAYLPYLIGNILMIVTINAISSHAVDKHYPYLVNDPSLPSDERKQIFSNVKNIFFKSLAGKVVDSTDNMLISKLIGTLFVGYCSNYSLILGVFRQLSDKVGEAITASFGNLFVTEDAEKKIEVLRRLTFIFYLIALVSSVGVYACVQPFIMIWLKDEVFLLSKGMVFLFTILLFTSILYRPLTTAMHLTGYFRVGRNISIVSAIVNLFVSIILGKMIGLPGIYIGTACTYIIEVVSKIYYIFKKYFKRSALAYSWMWGKMILSFCAICIILNIIERHISFGYILTFIVMGAIGMALAGIFVLVLFGKSAEMDLVLFLLNEYSGKLKKR